MDTMAVIPPASRSADRCLPRAILVFSLCFRVGSLICFVPTSNRSDCFRIVLLGDSSIGLDPEFTWLSVRCRIPRPPEVNATSKTASAHDIVVINGTVADGTDGDQPKGSYPRWFDPIRSDPTRALSLSGRLIVLTQATNTTATEGAARAREYRSRSSV